MQRDGWMDGRTMMVDGTDDDPSVPSVLGGASPGTPVVALRARLVRRSSASNVQRPQPPPRFHPSSSSSLIDTPGDTTRAWCAKTSEHPRVGEGWETGTFEPATDRPRAAPRRTRRSFVRSPTSSSSSSSSSPPRRRDPTRTERRAPDRPDPIRSDPTAPG